MSDKILHHLTFPGESAEYRAEALVTLIQNETAKWAGVV